MNPVFDLNRWVLYVRKHWNENRKKYLLSAGAIAGLLILWYSFVILVNIVNPLKMDNQVITYYAGMAICGTLYSSFLFAELSEGPKAIHFILVPASLFEKLLSAILYGVVLFFI